MNKKHDTKHNSYHQYQSFMSYHSKNSLVNMPYLTENFYFTLVLKLFNNFHSMQVKKNYFCVYFLINNSASIRASLLIFHSFLLFLSDVPIRMEIVNNLREIERVFFYYLAYLRRLSMSSLLLNLTIRILLLLPLLVVW